VIGAMQKLAELTRQGREALLARDYAGCTGW
jgi:hypothetical protein